MITDIKLYLIFGFLGIAALAGGLRLYLGKGVRLRLAMVVVTAFALFGLAGFVIGKSELNSGVLPVVGVSALFVAVLALNIIEKMVIRRYQKRLDELMIFVSRISVEAQHTAGVAADQAGAVRHVTNTIENLDTMSQSAATSANSVLTASMQASEKGAEGIRMIARTEQILQAIGQVREVVDLISDLADQLNLLAVNAGIEASKAGAYGRGFSVVASEVRGLAEQSKKAVVVIREAIDRTDEGQQAITAITQVVAEIAMAQESTSDSARQIKSVTRQAAEGIRQISDAMTRLSNQGVRTAQAAEQLEIAMWNLDNFGQDIRAFVDGGTEIAKHHPLLPPRKE